MVLGQANSGSRSPHAHHQSTPLFQAAIFPMIHPFFVFGYIYVGSFLSSGTDEKLEAKRLSKNIEYAQRIIFFFKTQ